MPASNWSKLFSIVIFHQIALAIGALTSSIGVRVRRFFGFVILLTIILALVIHS